MTFNNAGLPAEDRRRRDFGWKPWLGDNERGRSMSEWQPIETAPKDGTDILLALHPEIASKKGVTVAVMHYEDRPLLGKTWTAPGSDWSCDVDCATHWMPLPLTPNAQVQPPAALEEK